MIDGNKVILNRPGPDAKVEDVEFEPNEVYAIDMVVSSGEGGTGAGQGRPGVQRGGGGCRPCGVSVGLWHMAGVQVHSGAS